MPKGCVTCMDEMFRKMADNMNGLGPWRKLEGEGCAHGTKSVLYASISIYIISYFNDCDA